MGGDQNSSKKRPASETDSSNDDDERETKRQKLEEENKTLKAENNELKRAKEAMKKEYTEALATKQLEIDNLKTWEETIQMQKEEVDQMITSLNTRLESEQQEHEKALAGLQTEIKTLKENETSQSSNDEVLRAQKEQFEFVVKAQNEQFEFVGNVLSIPGVVEDFYKSPIRLPNYTKTINNPMWFGKIMKNVSSIEYNDWDEFVSDCRLVFANALVYNEKYPDIVKNIERIQAKVEEYIQERESTSSH